MARNPMYLGPGPNIEPEDLDEYEKTGDYIYQPKRDGMWAEYRIGPPNVLQSRAADKPSVSGSNAGDLLYLKVPLPSGSKLAGELEATSQWSTKRFIKSGIRHLFLFDAIFIGDEDLRKLTTEIRYNRLVEVVGSFTDPVVKERLILVPSFRDKFRERFEQEMAEGGEGCVLKRVDSVYYTYASDGKTDNWVRCKGTATEDFVLMKLSKTPKGTTAGRWGKFSDGELVDIFQAGPGQRVPAELLVPENIGKLVCEFEGKGRMDSGALRHAQWCRVREDKTADMCVMEAA